MMDNFLNIKCQYINRRGGGYLVELKAQGNEYLWRKQFQADGPDDHFQQMRIDPGREVVDRPVASHAVLAILDQLDQTAIPLIPPLTGGFDGVSYRLAIRNIESVASFEWWLNCPARWQPLEIAWQGFVALAED